MKTSGVLAVVCLASAPAFAQPSADQPPPPTPTTDPSLGPTASSAQQTDRPPGEDPPKQPNKEPGRGDFDAGGQARFPSGPDETGTEYGTFNWVAVDLKGRYYILDNVTLDGLAPLAVMKPDTYMGGEPSMIGGFQARLEAKMTAPEMPMVPAKDTQVGLQLTLGYMREGAMLLSEKDFPLFMGDFKPGIGTGLLTRVKLSSLIDFTLVPAWVYQSGTMESQTAVQIPMSLRIALGNLVKVSADLGVYTGDDYAFSGDDGGRISTGAAITLKLGKIVLHTGAGVASLLSGPMYPSIRDSVYVDVNVKYAK